MDYNNLSNKQHSMNKILNENSKDFKLTAEIEEYIQSIEEYIISTMESATKLAVENKDKARVVELTNRLDYIKYTLAHRKAFKEVEKKLLGKNTIRSVWHDLDKAFMYMIMDHDTAHNIHRATSSHHEVNVTTHDDYVEMVIDWECARFTKPDKPLNARDTLYKFYPHMESKVLPILEELGL